MGIDRKRAVKIAEEVLAVTESWQGFMKQGNVVDTDVAILERCFVYQGVVKEFVGVKASAPQKRPKFDELPG